MKRTIGLITIILMALLSYAQQPVYEGQVPELLYNRTQPIPTFISVTNLTMDFVDPADYLFVYTTENKCAGANRITGDDENLLVAFGEDRWDEGFKHNEKINFGLYDAQTRQFYKLTGEVTNWQDKSVDPKWSALNLLKFKATGIDSTIDLIIDEELAEERYEVKLAITGPDTWNLITQNEQYFFHLTTKNVKNYTITASGSGVLKTTKRWWDNRWWNYTYTPSNDESSVTLTAVATNRWTGELMSVQKTVIFEQLQKPDPEPAPDTTILVDDQYIKAYIIPVKKFNSVRNTLFVSNKTDKPIKYYFTLYRDHDKYPKVGSNGTVAANATVRASYLSKYNAVELSRIVVNNKYFRYNKKISLE